MRHPALALACLPVLASQAPNPPRVAIPRLPQAPSMAKDSDLSTWAAALQIREFGMIMPDDKGENRWPTTVHVGWRPDALYVAIEASAAGTPGPPSPRSAWWSGESSRSWRMRCSSENQRTATLIQCWSFAT